MRYSNFYNSIFGCSSATDYKVYAAQELEKMYRLVFLVVKIYIIFYLLCISLPLFFDTSFILDLWLGTVPEYSVPFIRILIGITCVDAMATPLMTVAHATGKIKIVSKSSRYYYYMYYSHFLFVS